MALNLYITNQAALDLLGTLKTDIDAGTAAVIEIFSGSQPADADAADGAGTLLATLTMSATAYGATSDANPNAIMTAAAITSDTSADATGTAAWFQMKTQAGGTKIIRGSVGTSGCDINFNTVAFTSGSTISISALTTTMPEH